jgi:hypothetical protein
MDIVDDTAGGAKGEGWTREEEEGAVQGASTL